MAKSFVKYDVIDRDVFVQFPELASEKERREILIDFAREERDKALAVNRAALGRTPDYDTRVDGVNARVESAKSTSTIEFEFQLAEEMYTWIAETLVMNSPVGDGADPRPNHPGLYRESHLFFVDGVLVNPGEPVRLPREEAVFVNIQPYARKIERGDFSAQAPAGVYQTVAKMARQRFSNYATISFGFRTPNAMGDLHTWASQTSLQPRKPRRDRYEWLRRQPAIVIKV